MKKEDGLFYEDGSFKTDSQIKRQMALDGRLPQMEFVGAVPVPLDSDFYFQKAQERSDLFRELSPVSESHVEINFPRTPTINVWTDLHLGHPETNLPRIQQEMEVIKNTGDSFVLVAGDMVDGIHWGGESGGEQSMSVREQQGFLRSIFRELKGKVIAAVSGEHDSKWAAKTGVDPYDIVTEMTGAPYIRGTAEIEAHVKDQDYKISASHRKRGFSMYNPVHPQMRESRFHMQGADVYVAGHTHKKGVSQEAIRQFDGANQVTHIASGAYKATDAYGQRLGFIEMKPEEMFGTAFRLHEDKHQVDVEYDILEANRKWAE